MEKKNNKCCFAIIMAIVILTAGTIIISQCSGAVLSDDGDIAGAATKAEKAKHEVLQPQFVLQDGEYVIDGSPSSPQSSSNEKGSVLSYDVDGDGVQEIFAVQGSDIYAWSVPDGTKSTSGYLPDFPITVPDSRGLKITRIHRIGADDTIDALLVAWLSPADETHYAIYSFSGQILVSDTPLGTYGVLVNSPVAADLDGDGNDEIVILTSDAPSSSSSLAIINADWSVTTLNLPYSQQSPAIGDVDHDGLDEIVMETGVFWDSETKIWVIDGDGTIHPEWRAPLPGTTHFTQVKLFDYDLDGYPDILRHIIDYDIYTQYIQVYSGKRKLLREIKYVSPNAILSGGIAFKYSGLRVVDHIYAFSPSGGTEQTVFLQPMRSGRMITEALPAAGNGGPVIYRDPNNRLMFISLLSDRIVVMDDSGKVADIVSFSGTRMLVADLDGNGMLDIVYKPTGSPPEEIGLVRDFLQYDTSSVEWPSPLRDMHYSRNLNYNR